MTNNSPSPDFADIPAAIAEPKRRRSLQLVWIIPIMAAIIGASLAVKSYLQRGPEITISFPSGEGLEVGKTKIKYKDVQVGMVKNLAIAKDRSHVIVTAELTREAVGLLVDDTRFWVVRARISAGSISGLGTLMGGSYIGVDAGKSQHERNNFIGLERAPVVTMDIPGSRYVLHATDIGSLDISSPIFYRRMQVGEVVAYELDQDGKGVTLKIFVKAPYDKYVKANTLFWHASGFDISLDASGVKVNSESMATILLGGISFQSPEDRAEAPPAAGNSTFTLFPNKVEALERLDSVVETYTLVFRESVRGLAIGTEVDLRGVTIGEVAKINIELDPNRQEFAMPVEIHFYPERLRALYRTKAKGSAPNGTRELLNALVKQGFRAQLRSGNMLTGQLYIALDLFPKAPPANIKWHKSPPEFPTMQNSMEQLQTALTQIVQKLEKLPLKELTDDARQTIQRLETTLKSADTLIRNMDSQIVPEARLMLEDARKSLDAVHSTLGSAKQVLSADAPLQRDMRETLQELNRAARSLRTLGEYLERHPESLLRGKQEDGR